MKWVLIVLAILISVILVIAGVGALLPKEHVATRSIRLHQPPKAVWQAITDYEKFPSWRLTVKRVEPLRGRDGQPAWREVDNHGQALPMEAVEWTPLQRMVTRIADAKLPFGGMWTYEITPEPGGCVLRITEDGEIYNPILRFMARFVFGYHATMDDYLKALGAKFGETPQLEN